MTEHLTDLFERLADEAPPLRTDLVSESMRQGIRTRRRRNALRMAGTATLVAAVAVGVTVLTRDDPRAVDVVPPVATPTTAAARDIPIARVVGDLFAAYGEISEPATTIQLETAGMTAVLTDPEGKSAGIAVRVTTYDGQAFPSATSSEGLPPTSCDEVDSGGYEGFRCQQVDGVLAVGYQVRSFVDERDQGAYANVVEVRHPDGLITIVRSYNSIDEKSGGAMLDKPLLNSAQLQTIALDPLWRRVQLGTE